MKADNGIVSVTVMEGLSSRAYSLNLPHQHKVQCMNNRENIRIQFGEVSWDTYLK